MTQAVRPATSLKRLLHLNPRYRSLLKSLRWKLLSTLNGYLTSEKKVKWTKQDISQREKLDPVFMAFMNASCFRKFALEYLQVDVNQP